MKEIVINLCNSAWRNIILIRKLNKISDEELVKLIYTKDQELYGEIISRYQNKLFFYVARYVRNQEDVKDILQDVFLKTFKNLRSFDCKRKFSSWIYRIAHNEAINFIRFNFQKKTESLDQNEYLKNTLGKWDELDKKLDRKNELEKLKKIVSELPLKYREPMILKFYEDKTYEEISDILRKPVNTIGTLINRGKKMLKDKIKIKQ